MLNCRRMSSLFFKDPISLGNVCVIYGVSEKKMSALKGKQSFNTDGTLFYTAPSSGPFSLSMFRGKCTTANGNSGSGNRQAVVDGVVIGRLTLIYNITTYTNIDNLCSSISFVFSQFIEGSVTTSNKKLTINNEEYPLIESPVIINYTYPTAERPSTVTFYLSGTVAEASPIADFEVELTYKPLGAALQFISSRYIR